MCKCAPSLKRLMADFAARGHVNSGCCGDKAHQARKSDHNADSSGYAHAQDIHEKHDHDLQPYVDFIMANPAKFKQVKYLIYEGHIYYPTAGARPAGKYRYTGPNAHASHLHVSIHSNTHFYEGSWYVAEAYSDKPPSEVEEEDDMAKTQILWVQDDPGTPSYVLYEEARVLVKIPDDTTWKSLSTDPDYTVKKVGKAFIAALEAKLV